MLFYLLTIRSSSKRGYRLRAKGVNASDGDVQYAVSLTEQFGDLLLEASLIML